MDKYVKETASGDESNRAMQRRIEASIRKTKEQYHNTWSRHIALVDNRHWGCFEPEAPSSDPEVNAKKPREYITVNEAGINYDRMMTFLLRQNPKILVRPTRPEAATAAVIQQAAINQEWRDKDCQSQLELATSYCVAMGNGWIESGFQRELNEDIWDPNAGNITYEDYIRDESVYLEAKDPMLMFYDLESPQKNVTSARWICEMFFKAPQDVLNNKQYRDYAGDVLRKIKSGQLSPVTVAGLSGSITNSRTLEKYADSDLWVMLKVYDKKFRTRKIFCDGIEDPLLEEAWPDHQRGFPYYHMRYISIPGKPYGTGLVEWMEDAQFELDRSRTHMYKHRRTITGGRMLLSPDVSPEDREKFLKGDQVVVVGQGRGVRDYIAAMEYPQLSPDEYRIGAVIVDDIRNATGVNEMMRGGNMPSRTSATEVNQRAALSSAVLEARAAVVDRTVEWAARSMLANMKAFYLKERIVELTGPVGEYWGKVTGTVPGPDGRYWVPYTAQDIAFDTEVEIESTSAPRTDPTLAKQQDLMELQIMAPLLQQIGGNLAEYIRSYFNKYGDKDAARYLPILATIPKPIMTQTEEQVGQAPQAAMGMNPQMQQINANAAPAQSDLMGQMLGGLAGNGGM